MYIYRVCILESNVHAHYSLTGSRERHHTLNFHHNHCWVIWARSVLDSELSVPPTNLVIIESKILQNPSFIWQYANWNVSPSLDQYWLLRTSIKKLHGNHTPNGHLR